MKLLIVDDSVVFRSQIRSAVESSLAPQSISIAQNGKIALQKLEQEHFDMMTLDLEMPEMNGLEVLQEIKRRNIFVKTIVFAAQTARSAKTALEALNLGAIEVVSKPNGEAQSLADALDQVKSQLIPILVQFGMTPTTASTQARPSLALQSQISDKIAVPSNPRPMTWSQIHLETFKPKAIVIGSSTGGPAALELLFANIKAPVSVPIFIVQHMPAVFTAILAQRIQSITGIETAEAKHGEIIKTNRIYVAPGDYHMRPASGPEGHHLVLDQGEKRCYVRPAVDNLFEAAAKVYESRLMGFVLTGMGEDGLLGSQAIKNHGGAIMIQDKESSVVWGMPGAIFSAGAYDRVGNVQECARFLSVMSAQNRIYS